MLPGELARQGREAALPSYPRGVQVSAVRIYPVKSAGGLDVSAAAVHPWGLAHDRRWMVVDPDGVVLTARKDRRLLQVVPEPHDDGGLTLTGPGIEALDVAAPRDGGVRPVTLSRVEHAVDAGDAAADWFSSLLGSRLRLVWLDDPRRRPVSPDHGGLPGDALSLADAGPILLTSDASLRRLDDWMNDTAVERGEEPPGPLPMVRFRPNIVVSDVAEAFAEDEWKRVRVGDVELRFCEHCDRCVVPTIDPVTLDGGKEPTRTLARWRQWDHKVHFGVRMVPETTGTIRVGDGVEVV